jgi:pyridoxal phosphate enzyme (YggS family)
MRTQLAENLQRVESRIRAACQRAGRLRDEVTLVAVTKSASPEVIQTLIELGVRDLAESRVQEFTRRAALIHEWLARRPKSDPPITPPRWHMIGHLQRNKVKALLPWVDLIHAVDTLRLAEEISVTGAKLGRVVDIMIEVHASEETTKQGIAVPAVTHFAAEIAGLDNLRVCGLMTMAPLTDDVKQIRQVFDRVRELFDEVAGERLCGPAFRCLSMGMSHDFEYAIEAGATHVRIGSALFEGIPQIAETAPADEPATDDEPGRDEDAH